MIKKTKGWKVIKRYNRMSFWTSSLGPDFSIWKITYPVNVEVFPNVEGSKLFFFKDRKDAEKFVFGDVRSSIVPCIATNAVKVKWMGCHVTKLKKFWEKRSKTTQKNHVPEGTWLADSITCLE